MPNKCGVKYIWDYLSEQTSPIVIYGMGDGAQKILDICNKRGIKISDIFASDEYVRGHSFAGYKVMRYSDVTEKHGDPIILLGFATSRSEVLSRIYGMAEKHTLLAPDLPLFGSDLFTPEHMAEKADQIRAAYELMSDDLSRKVFENTLKFKLSGDINFLRDAESSRDEVFNTILKPANNEDYIDLGAYDGDTISELLHYTGGNYSSVTAFEPDIKNMRKLEQNTSDLKNCLLYPYAAWSGSADLTFSGKAGRMSALGSSGYTVAARAADDICSSATYIKMDVEGAEYEALTGCRRLIADLRPKLAVSAYHRTDDFFTLPLYINQLNSTYRIYLRHHPYLPAWETNIYAV